MFQRLVVQRTLIGCLALIGVLAGGVLWLWSENQQGEIGGNLFRAGLVLGALWLALPHRWDPGAKRFSIWQGLAFLSVAVILARRPWIVLPVLLILGFLSLFARPRT